MAVLTLGVLDRKEFTVKFVSNTLLVRKTENEDYFYGNLSDGETKLRFVGFHRNHEKKLTTLYENKTAVRLCVFL